MALAQTHRARGTWVLRRRGSAQSEGRTPPALSPPPIHRNQQFSEAGGTTPQHGLHTRAQGMTGRHHHSCDESQKTLLSRSQLSPRENVPSKSPWASETSLCVLVRPPPPAPCCPPTPAAGNRSNGSQTVTLRTALSPHHSRESVPETPLQASSPCQHPPRPPANQGSARHPGGDPPAS